MSTTNTVVSQIAAVRLFRSAACSIERTAVVNENQVASFLLPDGELRF